MLFEKITLQDTLTLLDTEKMYLRNTYDNNTAKELKALEYLEQMLKTLPSTNILQGVESKNNNRKVKRDFEMVNTGTTIELLVKMHIHGTTTATKSKGQYSDVLYKGKRYEIKISLSGSCKNTKIKKPTRTMLINQKGVWLLEPSEVQANLKWDGVLAWNEGFTTKDFELSEMLGY